jgi:hypothetical protein
LDAPGCPMKNITINLDEQPKTVHGRVEKVRVNCFFLYLKIIIKFSELGPAI